MSKTNVMRLLDQKEIDYQVYQYDSQRALDGISVATILNKPKEMLFKTLVTISKTNNYYVFMVPVEHQLDLKKAAFIVGEKSIEMLPNKDLLKVTGYIHGGCSPIGMKKNFKTVIDDRCQTQNRIIFSGGKIGYQVEINRRDLKRIIDIQIANITKG